MAPGAVASLSARTLACRRGMGTKCTAGSPLSARCCTHIPIDPRVDAADASSKGGASSFRPEILLSRREGGERVPDPESTHLHGRQEATPRFVAL